MICLKNKDFLKLLDFTPEEIAYLLELAADLKAKKKAGIPHALCQGKNIALIFEKTSTRTRCAFEVAGHDLGMGVTYLDPTGSQIGKKESIADTARVLSRMFDGIEYRGFGQSIVEELAQYADVPVYYLSGMQNIEYSIYEAAKIDGASPLQTFFKITVPLLKPMILLTTITSTNGTLQLFDESLNLTNGGPGKSTMTMSHYIYNMSFVQSPNFGYAAAMSILILIMVAILALLQMKVGDER